MGLQEIDWRRESESYNKGKEWRLDVAGSQFGKVNGGKETMFLYLSGSALGTKSFQRRLFQQLNMMVIV